MMKAFCVSRYSKLLLLISLVGLVVSCGPAAKSEKYTKLERLLAESGYTGGEVPPNVLMIPVDGCELCIEEALNFALTNQYAKDLLIVASSTSGKKILFKLNKAGFGTKGNLVIDTNGLCLKYGFVASNPLWLKVSQNDLEIVMLEPTNIEAELGNLKATL